MTPFLLRAKVIAERSAWIKEMLTSLKALPLKSLEDFLADSRNVAAAESYLRRALESLFDLGRHILGKGIGVSGSALAGRAVFTAANIRQLRSEDPQSALILIRQDTVPEDIKEISLADGLLTSRGGQTSHAAVVATRLEKTCVVGCNALKVVETGEYCEINGQVIRMGDPVSIDGRKGLFLLGRHPVKNEVHILPI